MSERPAADWAARARRRWNAPRIAAAALLHLLALVALVLGTAQVRMTRHGTDRTTSLVSVTLAPSKPPPVSTPRPIPLLKSHARDARAPAMPIPTPAAPREPEAITLPNSTPVAIAARPAASAPSAPLVDILNTAATRQAIRDAARGTQLSALGNAATHEEQDSTMTYDDGHECPTCTRDLAAPKAPGERLTHAVKSAGRSDCLKQAAGTGIWALPVLIVTEAARQCSN